MAKKKTLSILFVGNSHTYFNDMPLMVKRRAEDEEYDCRVTMIAHPGWFLAQHAEEPDVRFNILYRFILRYAFVFKSVIMMYAADGEHASVAGSEFAEKCISVTIRVDMGRKAIRLT